MCFSYVLTETICLCFVCFYCVRFTLFLFFFITMPRDLPGRTSPKCPVLCHVGCKTLAQSINVVFVVFTMLATDFIFILSENVSKIMY